MKSLCIKMSKTRTSHYPEDVRRLPRTAHQNPTCQQHMAGLTYEARHARLFGILKRQWCMLGAKACKTLWGLPDFHSLQIAPCLPAGADPGLEKVNEHKQPSFVASGKTPCATQLLFMRHAGWVCSVVPWLALGKCPACFCLRDWKGLSPGQSLGRRKEAHPMPSVPSVSTTPGEAKGEGRRDKSWGQNDSGGLNTGVHLDLIGSNAPFQTPSAYLKRSLGTGSCPIVSPSFCKSIPV